MSRYTRPSTNPVQEIIQSHVFSPAHAAIEYVDAADSYWANAEEIFDHGHPERRPGKHLVAPGAQLLISYFGTNVELLFSRTLFVKHHHRWKFLASTTRPVRALLIGGGRIEMLDHVSLGDKQVIQLLVTYSLQQGSGYMTRENPGRQSRKRP